MTEQRFFHDHNIAPPAIAAGAATAIAATTTAARAAWSARIGRRRRSGSIIGRLSDVLDRTCFCFVSHH